MVQWLSLCPSLQGVQVWSLIRELWFHKPTQCGQNNFVCVCEKHNKYMSSDECSLKKHCFVIVKTHEKVETKCPPGGIWNTSQPLLKARKKLCGLIGCSTHCILLSGKKKTKLQNVRGDPCVQFSLLRRSWWVMSRKLQVYKSDSWPACTCIFSLIFSVFWIDV